jgi:hypothetical protein
VVGGRLGLPQLSAQDVPRQLPALEATEQRSVPRRTAAVQAAPTSAAAAAAVQASVVQAAPTSAAAAAAAAAAAGGGGGGPTRCSAGGKGETSGRLIGAT